MLGNKAKEEPDPMLRKLYPHLTDEELLVAEENLIGYLEVVLRIYERIRQVPVAYKKLKAAQTAS